MAFRTVLINTHSKVEYSLNYLVFKTAEETKRILLDEIHTVIFESTAVAVTTSLLNELVVRKIKVIFCDEKHNPSSELMPYYNAHNTSKRIYEQTHWLEECRNLVWTRIVKQKIINQALLLKLAGKEDKYKQLLFYSEEIVAGDLTNREGHAAKVFFNNIFYNGFTRNDDSKINVYLDYGYTILLSQFNRVIVSSGYLTQIGIHHIGETNPFNFSCDLIEPFRFLIDMEAMKLTDKDDYKSRMVDVLNKEVIIDGKCQTVVNAISIYFQSVINALNDGVVTDIKFINANEYI